jgi:anhydro-N-acetylmuramic acid kinase
MTGTSVDAVDVAFARFTTAGDSPPDMQIIATEDISLPADLREEILRIIDGKTGARAISSAHYRLARLFADATSQASKSNGIDIESIDAVGVHGQTVWHEPGNTAGHSLQIFSGPAMSAILNIPVVYDFRAADIALGGQGAPLSQIFDRDYLAAKNKTTCVLNIGGMANITIIEPDGNVRAFDTGPGNVLIDTLAQKYFSAPYDKGGSIARKGEVIRPLFDLLKNDAFVLAAPPKSTGREYYNKNFIDNMLMKSGAGESSGEDILRTFAEFSAWSIGRAISMAAAHIDRIYIAGGGLHNKYLVELIRNYARAPIASTAESGIPADHRESLCFAYLAWLRLAGRPGNIPSVTGAVRAAPLGSVAF